MQYEPTVRTVLAVRLNFQLLIEHLALIGTAKYLQDISIIDGDMESKTKSEIDISAYRHIKRKFLHILAPHEARTETAIESKFGRRIQYVAVNLFKKYHRKISIGCRDINCQTWSKIDCFSYFC